jgi:predicted Fe-S protein YdhL (DUF1289 family)
MQLEFFDVPSPCVGICQSDEKGLCLGCMRNRDERQNWNDLTNDDKQKVIKRCQQRKRRKLGLTKTKKIDDSQIHEQNSDLLQPSLLDPPSQIKADNNDDLDFGDFEL